MTDLAYYSSFQKEVDGNAPENAGQLQTEEFVPASMYTPCQPPVNPPPVPCQHLTNSIPISGTAIDKIIEDQQEFEKEHQFMQVCNRL